MKAQAVFCQRCLLMQCVTPEVAVATMGDQDGRGTP
jgi:hypothetical protein